MNAAHRQPPIATGKERPHLFGPVAKSRARFEVHGEVRFVSDLIAYHSSADAGTLVGAVHRTGHGCGHHCLSGPFLC
jgi:hypothetical protein